MDKEANDRLTKIVVGYGRFCIGLVLLGGIVGILLSACEAQVTVEKKPTTEKVVDTTKGNLTKMAGTSSHYSTIDVYELEANDGCTYIVTSAYTQDFRGGVSVSTIHSAACQNPKHGTIKTIE